jgi:hypothetical protein
LRRDAPPRSSPLATTPVYPLPTTALKRRTGPHPGAAACGHHGNRDGYRCGSPRIRASARRSSSSIGERSAHTWFVLHELLDLPNVKNCDGSWTEYGSLVGVPIETGD